MTKGKLIVIEGIDGSGKGTQASLLLDIFNKLVQNSAIKVTFPEYTNNFFGREVGLYLNGAFGTDVNPKFASLLYALDRFETKPKIEEALNNGVTVISDRYVSSNIAHQSLKLPKEERPEFMKWVDEVEYKILGLPRPDLTIFLNIPPEVSFRLIELKDKRNYTDKKKDIHEADINHLKEAHEIYSLQVKTFPNWVEINCVENGELKSIQEISHDVLAAIVNSHL